MQMRWRQLWTALMMSAVLGLVAGYAGIVGLDGAASDVVQAQNLYCPPPPKHGEWIPITVEPDQNQAGWYRVADAGGETYHCDNGVLTLVTTGSCLNLSDGDRLWVEVNSCLQLVPDSECGLPVAANPVQFCGGPGTN